MWKSGIPGVRRNFIGQSFYIEKKRSASGLFGKRRNPFLIRSMFPTTEKI